jgi:hypothetical protein
MWRVVFTAYVVFCPILDRKPISGQPEAILTPFDFFVFVLMEEFYSVPKWLFFLN